MSAIRGFATGAGAIAVAIGLLCAPADGTAIQKLQRRHATRFQPLDFDTTIGTFTPAAADPKLSGLFGRVGGGAGGFRFTPSVTPGSRRAVTVAVRAHATTRADAERIAAVAAIAPTLGIAPSAYSLGAAAGWRRFAIYGDFARVDLGVMPGSRESADVGVSFAGHSWNTRLGLVTDRSTGETVKLLGAEQSVALDLAGSYAIAHNLDVTGGLRYKMQHDRLELSDERRDSQAIYVGTAFRF